MKLNLSEREWVGELGALVPEGKTRANNRSQEGQGAVEGERLGLGVVRPEVCLFVFLAQQTKQPNKQTLGRGWRR